MNDLAQVNSSPADAEFDISDLMTDPVKELEGVWCDIGKGREVKIARRGNENANAAMRAKYRANQALLDQEDEAAFKLQERLSNEVASEHIIKGLRVNGKEVSYTPAKGLKLLGVRDFREKIFAHAGNFDHFKVQAEEAIVKD